MAYGWTNELVVALARLARHRVHVAVARAVVEERWVWDLSGLVDWLEQHLVPVLASDTLIPINEVAVLVEEAVGAHLSRRRELLTRNSWDLDWVEPPSPFHHLFEDFLFSRLVVCLILLADDWVLSWVVPQGKEVSLGVKSAIRYGLVRFKILSISVKMMRVNRSIHLTSLFVFSIGRLRHHRRSFSVGWGYHFTLVAVAVVQQRSVFCILRLCLHWVLGRSVVNPLIRNNHCFWLIASSCVLYAHILC